ncbi:hypothetical protein [Paludisphaera rhizosphaerae]|uniref:hypothetical protein n=1 Tax=Paludisphaera rhizosphaerae TaxID=2711216 RepID=UPI0013ED0298|nr:hypothetical protein [Paludisphaera rhizosphaerae]
MLATIAFALACSTQAWSVQDPVEGPRFFDVRVHLDEPVYPLGSPTFVNLELVNVLREMNYLKLDHLGLPSPLEYRLTAPDGRRSDAQNLDRDPNWIIDGPPIPHKLSELYPIKPGDSVTLRYDLARFFRIQRPGTYHLEVAEPGRPAICRVDFDVVGLEILQAIKINELCELPLSLFEKNNVYTAPIECHLEIGKVPVREGGPWFAVISDVMITGRNVARVAPPLVVPPKTRVAASAIDVRGQLWMVLVAEDASTLMIWDLKEGRRRRAIPWGKYVIELGSTPIRPFSKGKVVIAGVPGQPKLSTQLDAQIDQR